MLAWSDLPSWTQNLAIVVGVICCAVALLFVGLQQVQPRVIGDLSAAVENRKTK